MADGRIERAKKRSDIKTIFNNNIVQKSRTLVLQSDTKASALNFSPLDPVAFQFMQLMLPNR